MSLKKLAIGDVVTDGKGPQGIIEDIQTHLPSDRIADDEWGNMLVEPIVYIRAGEGMLRAALMSDVTLLYEGYADHQPREAVRWFSRVMESRLRENDSKPGWLGEPRTYFIDHLRDKLSTLDFKHSTITTQERLHLAADIANYAMMIADNEREALKREAGNGTPDKRAEGSLPDMER